MENKGQPRPFVKKQTHPSRENRSRFPQQQQHSFQPQHPGAKPIVNLQLYQPSKPPPPKRRPSYQPYLLPNPMDPSHFGSYIQSTFQPQIIKETTINIEGIKGDHMKAKYIFEDVLPGYNTGDNIGAPNSLSARNTTFEFIRTILFPQGDGQNIDLDEDRQSIFSHIKFIDLHSYNPYKFSSNPYKGLPRGIMLYRTCYPIRKDPKHGFDTICARESTGVNVRIYKMTEGAFMIDKLRGSGKYTEYDVWRDIVFYEYLRENILKKKVCPNFPYLFGYHMPTKSGINFDDLENINNLKQDYQPVVTVTGLGKSGRDTAQHINVNSYTGKTLMALTEASQYNLYDWGSVIYETAGNTKSMINTGYHPGDVWMGVFFQIMAGLYTMWIHGINIEGFSLDKNVFIKDLRTSGNVTDYWKYVIDGVEYYIPNKGYLVLIDSNYRDTRADQRKQKSKTLLKGKFDPASKKPSNTNIEEFPMAEKEEHINTKVTYGVMNPKDEEKKLQGEMFNDNVDKASMRSKIFDTFKRVISTNSFGSEFKQHGGCNLPSVVLTMLNNITRDPSKNFSEYFYKHMSMFINNRIGTFVKDNEKQNVNDDNSDIKHGEIAVHSKGHGHGVFCIFLNAGDEGTCNVLTKSDPKSQSYSVTNIPVGNVKKYVLTEPLAQKYKANQSNLNDDDLIEIYHINKEDAL